MFLQMGVDDVAILVNLAQTFHVRLDPGKSLVIFTSASGQELTMTIDPATLDEAVDKINAAIAAYNTVVQS